MKVVFIIVTLDNVSGGGKGISGNRSGDGNGSGGGNDSVVTEGIKYDNYSKMSKRTVDCFSYEIL